MAGGHLVQWLLYGVVAVRVEDGHRPVYAAALQQLPYAKVIGVYLLEREQPVGIGIVAFQYLQCLLVQRYPDGLRLAFLRLLRHVFQKAVLDVGSREPVKVPHSAADIAVEHEDVPYDSQFRTVAQIRVIQDVPLFRCEEERVAVGRLLTAVEGIDLVVGILHLLAPVQEGAEQVHGVDDGSAGKRSRPVVDERAGSVEAWVFLPQPVLVHDIIPEIVHLLQHDGLHEEGEVRLAQYLPPVVMVARHPALEAYDMFLGPFRAVKLFQILVDTGEQVRVVPLEGAGRVQHILDDLPHPPAVRLVREGLLRPLDDGGDLSGQAFLLGGRHSRRAPVTEGVGIPVPVPHLKGRGHLYVHALLPDPETDVRGLWGAFFQIDGNFHRHRFLIHIAKVNKFPYMFPYIPKKPATD